MSKPDATNIAAIAPVVAGESCGGNGSGRPGSTRAMRVGNGRFKLNGGAHESLADADTRTRRYRPSGSARGALPVVQGQTLGATVKPMRGIWYQSWMLSAVARCARTDCNSPMVMLVGDFVIALRCQMGHVEKILKVAPQHTGLLSWTWRYQR